MSDERKDETLHEDGPTYDHDTVVSDAPEEYEDKAEIHAIKLDSADPMATQEMLHVDRYEAAWMRITAAVIAVFFIAILISAFAMGFQLPGVYERIDPTTLYEPGNAFAEPGLRELAPGKYELYIRAQIWSFTPNEVHIPVGSEVTIFATSADVQHGFKLQNTNLNMMLIPGQISTLRTTFVEPGTYEFVCHEYCGMQHHIMFGSIIVDDPNELVDSVEDIADQENNTGPIADDGTTVEPENVTASEGETN